MNLIKGNKTNWKYILIILIFAGLVGVSSYWFLKKEIPFIKSFKIEKVAILPDKELCKYTKTGFFCVLTKKESFRFSEDYTEEIKNLEKQFSEACRNQGGKWECSGWCLPNYVHSCEFPLDDTGKTCVNSGQCKGKCVGDREYVEKKYPDIKDFRIPSVKCEGKCEGKCSEYFPNPCNDWYYEVNNGIIEAHALLCD